MSKQRLMLIDDSIQTVDVIKRFQQTFQQFQMRIHSKK